MNKPLLDDPKKYAEFVARIPMGRWGELHENHRRRVVPGVVPSSYMTGTTLLIDGGWTGAMTGEIALVYTTEIEFYRIIASNGRPELNDVDFHRIVAVFYPLLFNPSAAGRSLEAGEITNQRTRATRWWGMCRAFLNGACLEDVKSRSYGGIYSQMIFGESFQEPPPHRHQGHANRTGEAGQRHVAARSAAAALPDNLLSSRSGHLPEPNSQRIVFESVERAEIGIETRDDSIAGGQNFVAGKPYEGFLLFRAEAANDAVRRDGKPRRVSRLRRAIVATRRHQRIGIWPLFLAIRRPQPTRPVASR